MCLTKDSTDIVCACPDHYGVRDDGACIQPATETAAHFIYSMGSKYVVAPI